LKKMSVYIDPEGWVNCSTR